MVSADMGGPTRLAAANNRISERQVYRVVSIPSHFKVYIVAPEISERDDDHLSDS